MLSASIYYPVTTSSIYKYAVHAGSNQIYLPQVFTARLPRAVYIMFINNDQSPGKFNTNPYAFLPYGITSAQLHVNGLPMPALRADFSGGSYFEMYRWAMDNLGKF